MLNGKNLLLYLSDCVQNERIGTLLLLGGFMSFWRILLGGLSDRYWAAVWIPVLLLLGSPFLWKTLGFRLTRIIMVILCLAFLCKDFHLNWNNRAIINAAELIKADARRFSSSFIAESNQSNILSQIGYYAELPALPNRQGRKFSTIGLSAQGLYDVCYFVIDEKQSEQEKTAEMLKDAGAELIFSQDKDMHHKKQICVYRWKMLPQERILPKTGEIWPNGSLEKVSLRGQFFFPDGFASCHGISQFCTVHSEPEAISGKYSFYFQSAGQLDIYSALVSPSANACTIIFTVKSQENARIAFSIWKFNKQGGLISREPVLDAVLPDKGVTHQFQIPYSPHQYGDAYQIRFYLSIVAPKGILADEFGMFQE